MVFCLFPHCKNSQDIFVIPKYRKPLSNQRGKRKHLESINNIVNEQHYEWIRICESCIPEYKYVDGKRHSICIKHFHDTVIKVSNNGKKEPVLGALPTLYFCDKYVEVNNPKRLIDGIDVFKRMELEINLN